VFNKTLLNARNVVNFGEDRKRYVFLARLVMWRMDTAAVMRARKIG
jgi:hypothetical protein